MRPVGVGLRSFGPIGRGGIEDDDLLAALRGFDRFLFGEELRPLVVTDHVAERYRRVFVDYDSVAAEVHGGHTRCVDEALNAGLARQPQQLARAIDVGLVHGRGIGNPEAIICRHMHNRIAVLERGVQRSKIGEIANNGLARDAFEIRKVRGLAREQAQIGAFCGESFGDMMPNESGRACDKDFHGRKCSFILNA